MFATLLLTLWFLAFDASMAQQDASSLCFGAAGHRNNKDLYADPDDCHKYYQCFYNADSTASGIHRSCPSHQFWSEKLLTCVPEASDNPCQDPCQLQNGTKCYQASGNCASFFVCANTASYPMCCPEGTAFDQATCSCELDATCQDKCQLPDAFAQPLSSSARAKVVDFDKKVCLDAWGNYLRVNDDKLHTYWQYQYAQHADNVEFGERRRILQHCPPGLLFDLMSCACVTATSELPFYNKQTCSLYLPFDRDFDDHSVQGFEIFRYGDTKLDLETYAHGPGSLSLNGKGRIEVPGFKSAHFPSGVSWCFSYRCANDGCVEQGAILSNGDGNNVESFSIKIVSMADGSINVLLTLVNPAAEVKLTGNPSNQAVFNQVCIILTSDRASLYLNQSLADSQSISSELAVAHASYTIGSDSKMGSFRGYIDNFVVCPWALSASQIQAHSDGEKAMHDAGLVVADMSVTSFPNVLRIDNAPNVDDDVTFEDLKKYGFISGQHDPSKRVHETLDFEKYVKETPPGVSYPGLAFLIIRSKPDRRINPEKLDRHNSCQGALIRWQWVLTSGTCFDMAPDHKLQEIIILFGFRQYPFNRFSFLRRAVKLFRHEARYRENQFDYALIRLNAPVHYRVNAFPFAIAGEFFNAMSGEYLNKTNGYTHGNDTEIFPESRFECTPYDNTKKVEQIDGSSTNLHLVQMSDMDVALNLEDGKMALFVEYNNMLSWNDCQRYQPNVSYRIDDTSLCTTPVKPISYFKDASSILLHQIMQRMNIFILLGISRKEEVSVDGKIIRTFTRTCRCLDWIRATMKGYEGKIPTYPFMYNARSPGIIWINLDLDSMGEKTTPSPFILVNETSSQG